MPEPDTKLQLGNPCLFGKPKPLKTTKHAAMPHAVMIESVQQERDQGGKTDIDGKRDDVHRAPLQRFGQGSLAMKMSFVWKFLKRGGGP